MDSLKIWCHHSTPLFVSAPGVRFPRAASGASSALCACGVSLDTLLPQDKEGCVSDTSHEENARIFEESHPLRCNQQGESEDNIFNL
jgi:hypothetical protein